MRVMKVGFVVIAAVAMAQSAAAQTERTLTTLEVSVACGPPTSFDVPADPLRVIGAQDTVKRTIFNTADLLIVNGGTAKGVQLGQQYWVRRAVIAGSDRKNPSAIVTAGWISVVAINEQTAIAKVDHFCGALFPDDYLEPYVAPSLPAEVENNEPTGDLDFTALSKVMTGPEATSAGAGNSLMLIDRGEDRETKPGMRFAIYRDLHAAGIPLAAVGEGVVLSVGKKMSLTRITRSRDTVITGDYVVPRK